MKEYALGCIPSKKDIRDYVDRYYNLRREFFTSCVEEGQENAVQKILKKYPKNDQQY